MCFLRYYYAENWTPKKKEVLVELPDKLDFEHLRSKGLQPGEMEQPEDEDQARSQSQPNSNQVTPDADLVAQLVAMGMGFSENGLMRAAIATNNASPEAAMEWVLTHMGDDDFNEPLSGIAFVVLDVKSCFMSGLTSKYLIVEAGITRVSDIVALQSKVHQVLRSRGVQRYKC